jgi:hypothetical protein
MLWVIGVIAILAIVSSIVALRAQQKAEHSEINATKAATEASAARRAAIQGLNQQLQAYTRATRVCGEIAAAASRETTSQDEQQQLKDKLQELVTGQRPSVVTGDIWSSMDELVKRIHRWVPGDEQTSEDVRQSALALAGEYRAAWEGEVKALPPEATKLFQALIARPTYERAIGVTSRLAEGNVTPEDRDEFERLYWGELVLFETKDVEDAMVEFRNALEAEQTDLKKVADGMKQAAEAALSDLPKIDSASATEFEPRSGAARQETTAD